MYPQLSSQSCISFLPDVSTSLLKLDLDWLFSNLLYSSPQILDVKYERIENTSKLVVMAVPKSMQTRVGMIQVQR